MHSTCDRTHFPMVCLPSLGFSFHLLPVTKVQFERYLGDPGQPGDLWYDEILATAPRASWRSFVAEKREQLFLTGILPSEAVDFARWLGPDYRLPSREEWRTIYAELNSDRGKRARLGELDTREWDPAAKRVVGAISRQMGSLLLADVCLLRRHSGLVEWTRHGGSWIGLGSPRLGFHPNLWDPLVDDSVNDTTTRLPFVGFRLIGPAR